MKGTLPILHNGRNREGILPFVTLLGSTIKHTHTQSKTAFHSRIFSYPCVMKIINRVLKRVIKLDRLLTISVGYDTWEHVFLFRFISLFRRYKYIHIHSHSHTMNTGIYMYDWLFENARIDYLQNKTKNKHIKLSERNFCGFSCSGCDRFLLLVGVLCMEVTKLNH